MTEIQRVTNPKKEPIGNSLSSEDEETNRKILEGSE